MATLIAIGYPKEGTAEFARAELSELESELVIPAGQIAVIARDDKGNYHVHTTHHGDTGMGALFGGFWGLFGSSDEIDIDEAFEKQVHDHLEPDTSALLMVLDPSSEDKAMESLRQYGGKVIKTSLSDTDTKRLQDELKPSSPSGAGAAS